LRRNCLLKHVIEGRTEERIEVTGRQEGRRQQLLDDLKETKGYRKFEREAVDSALRRSRFGECYGPDIRLLKEYTRTYTGCPRRNVPNFGRVFLMLKYTDITQNTYIQS
jgi:hypothetical protein